MIAQTLVFVLVPCLFAYACFSDLLTMRISNRLCLAVLGLFPLAAVLSGMSMPLLGWHLAAGALTLVVAFSLFAVGWIGGGDAKFVAASALWLGFDLLLEYALISAVMGGGLTLALLFIRMHPLPAGLAGQGWLAHLHDRSTGIPYGIALGSAALLLLPESALFKLAI
jgi:prepilin peptidase CpaA